MGYLRDANGLPIGYPWDVHGFPWGTDGMPVGSRWKQVSYVHKGYVWSTQKMAMGYPYAWVNYVNTGGARATHGMPMRCPWDVHELFLVCPRATHGLLMGHHSKLIG